MKTHVFCTIVSASLALTAIAAADEPARVTPPSAAPTPTGAVAPTTTVTSTTTTTGADVGDASVTPIAPPSEPSSKETITLYEKHRPNKGLLTIGGVMFLGTYVTTAAVVAANPDSNDKTLYLPAVGPWLALKDSNDGTSKTLLMAGSGVLQGVGLGFAIASFLIPEKTAAATIQAKNVKMNILPTSYGAGGAGIGAVGTF